jgi:flavin-dependent thymidylate synthase
MRVVLAGYNIDSEVISELKCQAPTREDVTPETLSAAYARISRDPRPADVLRAVARAEVERARRSNQTIIFKMGHHSVAEHAVFNFDIIGVSRLAIEEVEKFRLCSYTEKSQRYIKLGDDFVLPEEIRKVGKEALFLETVRPQNILYHRLYEKLKPHFFSKNSELSANSKNHTTLDGRAKEDARYVVSLATEGQLGMTVNGRNLELLIRRLASKKLAELRELNRRIYSLAGEVAPSILLFTEACDFDSNTYADLAEKIKEDIPFSGAKANSASALDVVRLVDFTPDADEKILAALVHTASSFSFDDCLTKVRGLAPGEKKALMKAAFARMQFYDFPLREFEYADLTFDLIVSASCFAQFKRHRMATLTSQPYDPGLGITIPASIQEIGATEEFMEMMDRTGAAHEVLKKTVGPAADYILTNAHRRRVLLKVNARELYHIFRLREDASAQWDIREISSRMHALAAKVMPLTCLLLGGKDSYPEVYRSVFGRFPSALPPGLKK